MCGGDLVFVIPNILILYLRIICVYLNDAEILFLTPNHSGYVVLDRSQDNPNIAWISQTITGREIALLLNNNTVRRVRYRAPYSAGVSCEQPYAHECITQKCRGINTPWGQF